MNKATHLLKQIQGDKRHEGNKDLYRWGLMNAALTNANWSTKKIQDLLNIIKNARVK